MKNEKLEADLLAIKKEFNERIDGLLGKALAEKKAPEKFEAGKWYYRNDGTEVLLNLQKIHVPFDNEVMHGFGIHAGGWFTDCNCGYPDSYRPATKEEIESALVTEAKRRGFKEGVKFNGIDDPDNDRAKGCTFKRFYDYSMDDDALRASTPQATWDTNQSNPHIYEAGKWAEIIKDETIKIDRYPVVFPDADDLAHGNNWTTIDGHKFTKDFWLAAQTVARHSKAKVKIGCSHQFDLPLETIEKILKKL